MSQNVHGAPAPVWGLSIGCLGTAVVLGTCCILTLLAVGTSPGSLVIGGLLAVVVAPFYAGFLLWLDPLEHEPPWLLAIAALWGAGVATFVG
ncbi:MAG: hypothetical protein NZL87_06415, partial [Thermomicrobium sp.]|nr:hypothetical protein [Thermomicrobium sp.]